MRIRRRSEFSVSSSVGASRPVESHRIQLCLLGGSWVGISGVISKVTLVIAHIRRRIIITILITTHEPPSIAYLSCNGTSALKNENGQGGKA